MRKQLPLIQEMKDQYDAAGFTYTSNLIPLMKNGFVEQNQDAMDNSQKVEFIQRPGLTTSSWNVPAITPPGTNPVIAAAAADPTVSGGSPFVIYSDGTQAGTSYYWGTTQIAVGTFTASSWWDIAPMAGTTSSLYGNYVFAVTNGTASAIAGSTQFLVGTAGTLTGIVDADFPHNSTKTNFLAMDGYLYICTVEDGKLYNSDLNDPTNWTATGFINVNLFPGRVRRLMRIRNLIAAFKSSSIEFFENVGNPTPGSPLKARPELVKKYGATNTSFIVEVDDGIVFVGKSPSQKPGIYKLRSSDLEVEEISTPFISQLVALDNSGVNDGLGNSVWNAVGSKRKMGVLPFRNKKLIMVPLMINHSGDSSPSSNYGTFVYDPDVKAWYLWTTSESGTEVAFPTMVIRAYNATTRDPITLAGFDTGQKWFTFLDYTFGDNGAAIDVKLVTNVFDFGTFRRKFMASLELGYAFDKPTGSDTAIVDMRYSDNGGISYSTLVSKSVTTGTYGRLVWRRLGQFRNRRFVITKSGLSPFKITVMEVDLMAAEDDID